MEIAYLDEEIIVCVKPAGVLSTDEPGGLPELLRQELQISQVRTVHRLDRVVSGLMVLARTAGAASELSRQIRDGVFEKEYLAVLHGHPDRDSDTLRDLLYRDKARKMTFVAEEPARNVQEAILHYRTDGKTQAFHKVRIRLETGRTHQIRVQFASRDLPLVGERKYAQREDPCDLALWSCFLGFHHPQTGEKLSFFREPPCAYPWELFD